MPLLLIILNAACGQELPQSSSPIHFVDRSNSSGIDFVHSDGGSGDRFVVEAMTGGIATLDFDGDGLKDIYFVNGRRLSTQASNESALENKLYRNLDGLRFQDVTSLAGVGDPGFGLGVTAADFDNDGDEDIYVTNYGPNVFYVNNGDGTFTEAAKCIGVAAGDRFGAGAVFFDMDTDGDLDLYCANYQEFSLSEHKVRMIGGHQFHPGPRDYPPATDNLFRNNGDGTYDDVSRICGLDENLGTGMGVIATDIDGDRDVDLFVANDSFPNFALINDGTGLFTEEGLLSGLAYDRHGKTNGNMGVDCSDIDNDGLIDIISTTYQQEMPVVYRNSGTGIFTDESNRSRVDTSLFAHVNWGVGAADFDNDGDRDLYIACGHFMDNIHHIDDSTSVKVKDFLLENNGNGKFATIDSNMVSAPIQSSRGAAFDDLNGDGLVDIVVQNANAAPTLLANATDVDSSWLTVRLVGQTANRQGIGARVTLRFAGAEQVAEVHAGRGYQSHYGNVLHFGIPLRSDAETANASALIVVDWGTGDLQHTEVFSVNREVVIVQGSGEEKP